jgi:hypothetical protein
MTAERRARGQDDPRRQVSGAGGHDGGDVLLGHRGARGRFEHQRPVGSPRAQLGRVAVPEYRLEAGRREELIAQTNDVAEALRAKLSQYV